MEKYRKKAKSSRDIKKSQIWCCTVMLQVVPMEMEKFQRSDVLHSVALFIICIEQTSVKIR
jgi:hypothetical protein